MNSREIHLFEDLRVWISRQSSGPGTIAIGIDVVSVEWMARHLTTRAGQALVATRFSPDERLYCDGRPERLAGRWAAKEAVAKAVGTGFRAGLRPLDIEIQHHELGQPLVAPFGGATWPHDAHTWPWNVTICHEGDAAISMVAAVPFDANQNKRKEVQ